MAAVRGNSLCSDHPNHRNLNRESDCTLYAAMTQTRMERWPELNPDYPKNCLRLKWRNVDRTIWNTNTAILKPEKRNAKAMPVCLLKDGCPVCEKGKYLSM